MQCFLYIRHQESKSYRDFDKAASDIPEGVPLNKASNWLHTLLLLAVGERSNSIEY